MIKWHLRRVMNEHQVKGVSLSDYMGITAQAVSELRKKETMPKIDGERLNALCNGLNALGKNIESPITPHDLIEYVPDIEKIRSQT